jgi:hypothetical protein
MNQTELGSPPGVFQLSGPAAHSAQPHSVTTQSHASIEQELAPIQDLESDACWCAFGGAAPSPSCYISPRNTGPLSLNQPFTLRLTDWRSKQTTTRPGTYSGNCCPDSGPTCPRVPQTPSTCLSGRCSSLQQYFSRFPCFPLPHHP